MLLEEVSHLFSTVFAVALIIPRQYFHLFNSKQRINAVSVKDPLTLFKCSVYLSVENSSLSSSSSSRVFSLRGQVLSLLHVLCCMSAPCWWRAGLRLLLGVLLGQLREEEVHALDQDRVQNLLLLWGEATKDVTFHWCFPCRSADPDPKSGHDLWGDEETWDGPVVHRFTQSLDPQSFFDADVCLLL